MFWKKRNKEPKAVSTEVTQIPTIEEPYGIVERIYDNGQKVQIEVPCILSVFERINKMKEDKLNQEKGK